MPSLDFCPHCRPDTPGTAINVNYGAIFGAFGQGKMIGRKIDLLMTRHFEYAKDPDIAPNRTGRLRRLHYQSMGPVLGAPPDGPTKVYHIGTTAGYAHFLKGTAGNGSGRIYPKNGDFLIMRPIPYNKYFVEGDARRIRESVRGQRPHPRKGWLNYSLWKALLMVGIAPKAEAFRQMDKYAGD